MESFSVSDFVFGVFIGFIACTGFTVMTLLESSVEIETREKLIPEWKLVTNGKVVDTIYIYKEK